MKFCNKCGDPIEPNEKYCNRCGNFVGNCQSNQPLQNQSPQSGNQSITSNLNDNFQQGFYQSNQDSKKYILIGIGAGFSILLIVFIFTFFITGARDRYYFGNDSYSDSGEVTGSESSGESKGKYQTAIIYDHQYTGVSISGESDARKLIVKDSVDQKDQCPTEVKKIEDEMISNYGITAVNLCEMDPDFAREIGNVFKKIYQEYPSVRGYITNLTLVNASLSESYIAAFAPVFPFVTSNTDTTYPWVIKTQILLNTSYFLNQERLQQSVKNGSDTGHFPPNATIYSPVAHELGHYLSFLAMMRYYQMKSILLLDDHDTETFYELTSDFSDGDYSLKMIQEAYSKYKADTHTSLTLDEWRGTISDYALAKDNKGEYIYDETIAEAFHDVYLNGDSAKDASKYVVSVLKSKLEG